MELAKKNPCIVLNSALEFRNNFFSEFLRSLSLITAANSKCCWIYPAVPNSVPPKPRDVKNMASTANWSRDSEVLPTPYYRLSQEDSLCNSAAQMYTCM